MTDKEFDSIIKDALLSEEVPPQLNQALFNKLKKKKHNKIISFTKPATYAAAVFVCAVAVLGYFNSDMPLKTKTVPEKTEIISKDKEIDSDLQTAVEEKETSAETNDINPTIYNTQKADVYSQKRHIAGSSYAPEKNTSAEKEEQVAAVQEALPESGTMAADSAQSASVISENTTDVKAAEAEKFDELPPLQKARSLPGEESDASAYGLPAADAETITAEAETEEHNTLSDLFTEGYDYISTINTRVTEQIASLPHSDEYTFTGISGNEDFSLSEKNTLTVNFDAGTIAPEEHGEQFFTVGTVENGVLE